MMTYGVRGPQRVLEGLKGGGEGRNGGWEDQFWPKWAKFGQYEPIYAKFDLNWPKFLGW